MSKDKNEIHKNEKSKKKKEEKEKKKRKKGEKKNRWIFQKIILIYNQISLSFLLPKS